MLIVVVIIVCTFDPTRNYIRTFEGSDCIYDMIKEMHKVSIECIQELKNVYD